MLKLQEQEKCGIVALMYISINVPNNLQNITFFEDCHA